MFPDVVNLHDVGVVQACQGFGLGPEPRQLFGAEGMGGQHHFQGHQTMETALLCLVDHAHAAAANLLDHFIAGKERQRSPAGVQSRPEHRRDRERVRRRQVRRTGHGADQEARQASGFVIAAQEILDRRSEISVSRAGYLEKGDTICWRLFHRLMEQGFHTRQRGFGHDCFSWVRFLIVPGDYFVSSEPSSRLFIHALMKRQCRCRLRSDRPSTWAVSAAVMPAKYRRLTICALSGSCCSSSVKT